MPVTGSIEFPAGCHDDNIFVFLTMVGHVHVEFGIDSSKACRDHLTPKTY